MSLNNIFNYEEHARQLGELNKIKSFKELAEQQKKAKSPVKKQSPLYRRDGTLTGDFYSDKPNIVKVTGRYAKKGTVLLGLSLEGKIWRFGHKLSDIHPETYISVEGGQFYRLPTTLIYDYIAEFQPAWVSAKYGIFISRAYVVEIRRLIQSSKKEII
jgi:hypothetical protein